MDKRQEILELIEAGEISVEEGARRLEGLVREEETPEKSAPEPSPPPAFFSLRPTLVRILWQVTFWTGAALLVGGALLVTAVYVWSVETGWLVCGWPLFIVGVLGVVLGWWLRRARWMSIRVRQPKGPNVALALPLPLGLVAGVVRILRPFVPQLRETGMDELILAMRDELEEGHPLIVEVDEGEDGEQVQVYFG